MLTQVYGGVMSRARVFQWCKQFSEGRDEAEFDRWPGRDNFKSNEPVKDLRTLVLTPCHQRIAEEININRETVQLILKENLGMKKVWAKIVPKNLTKD
jgi:hypothetical protein